MGSIIYYERLDIKILKSKLMILENRFSEF